MSEPSTNPLRRALRALTHGLYVLGVQHAGRDDYLIVALAMQCSVEPARVALAISPNARILPALRAARGATLGILDVSEAAAVRRYGAPGGVRHPPVEPLRTADLHPLAPEASYWLALRIVHEVPAGDHLLFIADTTAGGSAVVTAIASGPDAPQAFMPLTLAGSGFPYAG